MAIFPNLQIPAWVRAAAFVAVWVIGLIAPPLARAQDASWSEAKLEKARTLLDEVVAPKYARAGRIPKAISVAVAANGRLVYGDGRGEARPGVTAGPETVYHIGSITKQFLAAAVLNAIEEHRLVSNDGALVNLESKVSSILPETAGWDEASLPPLTLRSLLTMTSDIANFTRRPPTELDPWGAVPSEDLRRAIARMPRQSGDGSFSYSNTGYFLLSEILRLARSDRSYQEAVREFAIARARLENTGFAQLGRWRSTLAEPSYGRPPAFVEPAWLQGSADMLSTAADLSSWNAALMQGKVLGPHALSCMLSDAARVDVWTYYGMGWFITHKDGVDTFFHSGSVPGYTAFNAIYRYAGGMWTSISILTNSDGVEDLPQLADDLSAIAIREH